PPPPPGHPPPQRGRGGRRAARRAARRGATKAAARKLLIRGEWAARRGLARLGRRLNLPLTEDSLDGLVATGLYAGLAVALIALGRLNAWFIAGAFEAPVPGIAGALVATVVAGGLLWFALLRSLDSARVYWPL